MTNPYDRFKSSLPWLQERTILLVEHGSHAYGTNLPTSDLDLKGIAIPPTEYFLGYLKRFEQAEGHEPDVVIYDIRKFFSLAAQGNPNILEVLYGEERHIVKDAQAARTLRTYRDLFLSKKCKHTFSGYALAQLKKISSHRHWLLKPPTSPPKREDFGLPPRTVISKDQLMAADSFIQKKLYEWDLDLEPFDEAAKISIKEKLTEMAAELAITRDERYRAAGRAVGLDENFLVLLDRERSYRALHKEWEQYLNWKENRNEARSELEKKYGYDTKHGMHLVRLMRMCREILTEGKVIVKRPDAQELLAIRNGAWSYDKILGWAKEQDLELNEIYKTSTLPHSPNHEKLDELCQGLVEDAMAGKGLT